MKIHHQHVVAHTLEPLEFTIDVDVLDASTYTERKTILGAPEFVVTVRSWAQFVAMVQSIDPTLDETRLREIVDEHTTKFATAILTR